MSELRELYQEVIIEHGRHPRNFGALPEANHHKQGHNPLCGDKLTLHVHQQYNQIVKLFFEGSGCAISMASASLMTEALSGKSKEEFDAIFEGFHELVTKGTLSDDRQTLLGKLTVLAGVSEFPARVKCATLAWHTMNAIFQQQEGEVSTEESLITLTDDAVAHIQKLMSEENNAIGFRLSLKKTGCSGYAYVPEIATKVIDGDLAFVSHRNLNVYIDPACQDFIKGMVIDFVEDKKSGLKQKRLVFKNPNEKNRCGCGESFTLGDK